MVYKCVSHSYSVKIITSMPPLSPSVDDARHPLGSGGPTFQLKAVIKHSNLNVSMTFRIGSKCYDCYKEVYKSFVQRDMKFSLVLEFIASRVALGTTSLLATNPWKVYLFSILQKPIKRRNDDPIKRADTAKRPTTSCFPV